jgi:hypothetical protein
VQPIEAVSKLTGTGSYKVIISRQGFETESRLNTHAGGEPKPLASKRDNFEAVATLNRVEPLA